MESLERKIILPYLCVLFVVGCFFVFGNTPLTGLDERFHFFRSLQVSQGDFLASEVTEEKNSWGGCLPSKYVDYVQFFSDHQGAQIGTSKESAYATADTINQKNSNDLKCFDFPSTATFSPVMYIPSVIGIKISEIAGFGVNGVLFSGRLSNLFFFLLTLFAIYKIMPVAKFPTVMVFSFPSFLNLASSYSADPVTNMVTMAFIGYCLRMALLDELHFKKILFLAVLVGLVKLTNVTYLPLVLLVPAYKFSSINKYIYFMVSTILFGVIASVIWNKHFTFIPADYWHSGGDVKYATSMLMNHPLDTLRFVFHSIFFKTIPMFNGMFGFFGGGPAPFNWIFGGWYCVAALILIFLYLPASDMHYNLNIKYHQIFLMIFLSLGSIFIIFLAFYIGFSSKSEPLIRGVQGRYFIVSFMLIIISAKFIILKAKSSMLLQNCMPLLAGSIVNIKTIICALYLILCISVCIKSINAYSILWY